MENSIFKSGMPAAVHLKSEVRRVYVVSTAIAAIVNFV